MLPNQGRLATLRGVARGTAAKLPVRPQRPGLDLTPASGPKVGEPVQEHHYSVDIEASPDELWQLFWARIPHTETGEVTIDILHPGDAVGQGLVRHCTFHVPRYLLTGGKGQSWEWLTEVTPQVSWKYNAVGRPLFSEAEGRTRLEDLGNGTTRLHFSETYHGFNPFLRALLERRVHAFHLQGQRPAHQGVADEGRGVSAGRQGQGTSQGGRPGSGPRRGRPDPA